MPTPKTKELTDILGNTFDLQYKEVDVDRHEKGTITLPANMSTAEGAHWLNQKLREEETWIAVNERVEGYPIDVAYSLELAVKELFGFRELRSTPGMWFEDKPPAFISVPVTPDGLKTVEVFLGRFAIPNMDGFLETGREFNDALWIKGKLRQKNIPTLRMLLERTKRMLQESSLYKGKAFRVEMEEQAQGFESKVTMANPQFIDLRYSPAQLLLKDETASLVRAAIWTPIQRREQSHHYGIPSKRGVLLYGMYGTGKTLTAHETAQVAVANGWTYMYCKNVRDLKRLYAVAARWAPVVLFAEDIDIVMRAGSDDEVTVEDGINMLNNVLDGVDSKNKDIILVLTTNHINELPASLLRPGRFDAIIEYTAPDSKTSAKLVEQYAKGQIDYDNFDADHVGRVLEGKIPATIHEVVKRASLFAMGRYPEEFRENLKLSTSDIVNAARSMEEHLRLLNRPTEESPSAVEVLGRSVGDSIVMGVREAVRGHRYDTDDVDSAERAIVTRGNGQDRG